MLSITYNLPDGKEISATGATPRTTLTEIIKKMGLRTLGELQALKLKGDSTSSWDEAIAWTKSDYLTPDEIVN